MDESDHHALMYVWHGQIVREDRAVRQAREVVVYYCRTDDKAVSGGGEREKGGHVLRDTTSRGLYVRFWPPHTSERRGGE